jgi:hypothetical protein
VAAPLRCKKRKTPQTDCVRKALLNSPPQDVFNRQSRFDSRA